MLYTKTKITNKTETNRPTKTISSKWWKNFTTVLYKETE